ncbi:MAG: LamG domain-containing protein [Candidatus Nanohaloarchaea archaeon]
MVDLRWDGNDFRNEQSSSGSTADLVSHSGKLQQGYKHGSLTRGLVAYYPMDEGEGEVLHDGALDNLGQINGASWNGSGQVGSNSLSFDGTDDYVSVPNLGFGSGGDFTIAGWVKPDGSSQYVYGRYDGSGDILQLYADPSNDLVQFSAGHVGGNRITVEPSISIGNSWYHLTAVFDSSRPSATVYVDGVDESSASSSVDDFSTTGNAWIGGRSDGVNGSGLVDNVAIYDRALSQPEIQALYNRSQPSGTQVTEKKVPSQDQGGVSRYKFNGDVTDSWGSNDGTDNTSVSPAYETGVYGQAKNFDGTDDYVSLPVIGLGSKETFTISAWFNTDSSGIYQNIFAESDQSGSNARISSNISSNDKLRIRITNDSGTTTDIRAGSVSSNTWNLYTATSDGSTVRIFKDGKQVAFGSWPGGSYSNIDWSAIGRLKAGGGFGNEFSGKIDDVRIYNTALTPQQVEKLYHKGAYRIPRESTLQ